MINHHFHDGAPIAGKVIDPVYHVNLAWHGRDPEPAVQASLVLPATPSRGWDLAVGPPPPAPVPDAIPAWKGLAWLERAGELEAAEVAAHAGAPVARHAWVRASEWHRSSPLMNALAAGLGMTETEIDTGFIAANEIVG